MALKLLEFPKPNTLAHGVLSLLIQTGGVRGKTIYRNFPSLKTSSLLTFMSRGGLIEHEDIHKTTSNFIITKKGTDIFAMMGDYPVDVYWDQYVRWTLECRYGCPIKPGVLQSVKPPNPKGYMWSYLDANLDTLSLLKWLCEVISLAFNKQVNPTPMKLVTLEGLYSKHDWD